MGALEVLQQLLIGRSLFKRIELNAVQILQQCVPQHIDVVGIPDHRRDLFQAGFLRGAQATLTHDELVARILSLSGVDFPHHDRLEKPHFRDGGGKFGDVLLIEYLSRLARVRMDQADRNLCKMRAGYRNEIRTIAFSGIEIIVSSGMFVDTSFWFSWLSAGSNGLGRRGPRFLARGLLLRGFT